MTPPPQTLAQNFQIHVPATRRFSDSIIHNPQRPDLAATHTDGANYPALEARSNIKASAGVRRIPHFSGRKLAAGLPRTFAVGYVSAAV